jgi:uncharacterized protein (TIGR00661 family)
MATIVYSVNGEGRGHATRVQAIVEMLIPRHRFILLASEDAYAHFRGEYNDHPNVKVSPIPGLKFKYHGGKLSYVRSVFGSVPFLWNLRSSVRAIERVLLREQPDLAITDFEPLLPRAATRLQVPWLSLDHQHFLSVSDFGSLPALMRWQSRFLRCSIGLFYRGQIGEAVSSFAHLPARNGCEQVERIGVLVRRKIQTIKSRATNAGHLLVYVRGEAPDRFWDALSKIQKPVYVFGKCLPPVLQNIEYFGIQNEKFIRYLASCDALITTAGNQLVGEAFYLGKPVLAIPERGNFEQCVNGWLVSQSQGGWSVPFDQITPHVLSQFLLSLPLLRHRIDGMKWSGNEEAKAFIERHLPAIQQDADSQDNTFQNVA